jgi:putative membrane-bound dehydrogenase-like protein
MHFYRSHISNALLLVLFGSGLIKADEALPSAQSPETSRKAIQLRPGFEIELVAAEPLVADPVAFDWSADGKLWVAEMGDYPNGATWNGPGDPLGEPGGRVKLLTDEDGDGKYDRADLFLDKVTFPNGVKAWRDGVLVTAAPEIFYAEDTDGDGIADKREVLYQGFVEGNQQHRMNGLRWGLDNWLYLANGDSGGKVKSLKTGKTIDIRGRDLRIRPDTGEFEAISGQTQFGRNRDDWGNWFGGNNSNPMWHYVLDDRYLSRNPHFAPPSVRHPISNQPGAAPVFPTSHTLTRFNDFDKADRFTSACSPIIYRDELLGRAFIGNAFICEPVHNLVHREVVSQTGATFSSQRSADEQSSEFLASSDNWFRPTMVRTGPDGALWVADMYRLVIEHPEWIPKNWQEKLDLRAGHDRGRIYRVYPTSVKPRAMPRLDRLDSVGLVESLDNPNGWQRDLAQQMLLRRDDPACVGPLRRMASAAARPGARLHAVGTLAGLGKLDQDVLATALKDEHAGVRRHAVRLAEPFLNDSNAMASLLVLLTSDPDEFVRLQAAYSLGEWDDPRAARELMKLAMQNPDDRHLRAAIFSSLNERSISAAIAAVLSNPEHRELLLDDLLSISAGMDRPELLAQVLPRLLKQPRSGFTIRQFRTAASVLDALQRRGKNVDEVVKPEALNGLIDAAQRIALDQSSEGSVRLTCIRLLGLVTLTPKQQATLLSLLRPQQSSAIQSAAATALAARNRQDAARQLLGEWRSYSPALRTQILDTLLSRTSWTQDLLASLESGAVSAAVFDARRRQQLLQHRDAALRDRAGKIFATATSSNREAVVKEYQTALKLDRDAARGKAVFTKRCAACHRLDGVGKPVGPELTALTDKSPQSLLVAILDPNRAVEDKFRGYLALTTQGRQFSGMITNETGNSITLAAADGKEHVILRTDLDEMVSTGKSMMPEGIEKELPPQDLADVIAFVRSISSPPKQFPGNKPQVAPVRDDGSIRCLAMHARIYGPTLVFEDRYRNLGFWGGIEDHAVWSLDVPHAGRYRVSLDYACDNGTAGNRFLLSVAGQTTTGVVVGSGTWDDYRSLSVGAVDLPKGATELTFRSDGKIRSYLIDLRGIRLVPER